MARYTERLFNGWGLVPGEGESPVIRSAYAIDALCTLAGLSVRALSEKAEMEEGEVLDRLEELIEEWNRRRKDEQGS